MRTILRFGLWMRVLRMCVPRCPGGVCMAWCVVTVGVCGMSTTHSIAIGWAETSNGEVTWSCRQLATVSISICASTRCANQKREESGCPSIVCARVPGLTFVCVHAQLATPRWEIVNAPPTAQNLHLSYHDGEHYNSVRNKSDPGGGPAEKIVIGTPTSGPGGSSAVNMVRCNPLVQVIAGQKWQLQCVQPTSGMFIYVCVACASRAWVCHVRVWLRQGDVANADERLVMQSTGKSLEEVRETLEMLGGDAGYAIEYLIAMANDEAEQAAASAPPSTVASSEPRGAAAVAVAAPAPSGGVDGDGSAGGDVGVPPSLVAAAAGMSEEAAMAAALRASLEDAQAKKPARHGGDGSGGGNGGTVTSGKKEKKKKSKMPLKKGAPCPCGSGRKYGKCCRKRMKHLERLCVGRGGGG